MNSDKVTQGVDRAPHRSLFYAAGFTDEELSKPLIGVVCAQSDIIPGHKLVQKALGKSHDKVHSFRSVLPFFPWIIPGRTCTIQTGYFRYTPSF